MEYFCEERWETVAGLAVGWEWLFVDIELAHESAQSAEIKTSSALT